MDGPAGAAGTPAPGTPAPAPAIETTGLSKHFGKVPAVDGIDLHVPVGSVFGFLGPNGSGKTTTIRVLLGLLNPTAGTWMLFGRPMPQASMQILPKVGALIEGPAFYPWLSGAQNLARFDAAGPDGDRPTRRARIDLALARVGLTAAAGKKYKAYSLGMRQRLGLASALLRPRELLVLDEPTNGMDPQGTREIRHLIQELAGDGTTVFLSSHLLSEVEQVCTHVAVMSLGKILAQSTIAELQATGARRLAVETVQVSVAATVLERLGLTDLTIEGDAISARLDGQAPEDCCRALVDAGVGVRSLTTVRPTLEDTFVALTGEGFDVAR
ncbi:MAG: type transport system ATP-binding protein [Acidimicrobiaceae bacterium]|nr:type transport system ATP-binding protein [Acidimicrobiaceae bacterium]